MLSLTMLFNSLCTIVCVPLTMLFNSLPLYYCMCVCTHTIFIQNKTSFTCSV